MSRRSWLNDLATSVRFVSLPFGLALVILGLFFIVSVLQVRPDTEAVRFFVFYELLLAFVTLAGGIILVHSITRNVRIRVPSGGFFRFPRFNWQPGYGYGFLAALGLGLGATLGSPLFVLIPVNVLQFGVLSIAALVVGATISLLLANLYSRMYKEWNEKGRDCTDGPSFTKNACGRISLRYFIARFGLWIANTTFASYSLIISASYANSGLSQTLQPFLNLGSLGVIIPILFVALVAVWFVVNAFFEKRYAKTIGAVQVGLTVLLCGILLYVSGQLASTGNRPFASLLNIPSGDIASLFIIVVSNTALLFLHFFGFQEIQALSSDLSTKSSIPGLAFFKRFKDMDRVRFAKYAMIGSVVIASFINLFYAVGVYVASPNLADVQRAAIPAVYISQTFFGPWSALFMGMAFIIASLTTFVPAFLASSRHLRALSTDGFFPQGLKKSAWIFSLAAIVILSLFNGDFLVKITDFSVLVALALVSLAAVWSRRPSFWPLARSDIVPIVVGFACLLAAGALYLIDSSVVLFGILFIMAGYLIFDIFELGYSGSLLFLTVLYLVQLGLTEILKSSGLLVASSTVGVSLQLIQTVLQAALVVFGINIVLGARQSSWLQERVLGILSRTRNRLSARRKAKKSKELDKVVDQWIRLMGSDERIKSKDPKNFDTVKRYLEQRLAALKALDREKP